MVLEQKSLNYIITFLIALAFAIPVFLLFPPEITSKFGITSDEFTIRTDGSHCHYIDLDNDGVSERLISGSNNPQSVFITISIQDGIIGQWNFPGVFPVGTTRFVCADLDNNGIREVYVFAIHHDSLWLYSFNPMQSDKIRPKKVLVSTIKSRDGLIEAYIREGGIHDMNSDGYPDLIFAVEASFSAYPRKVAIYDAINHELRFSKTIGAGIHELQLFDLDGDGLPEIILNTVSHCNTTKGEIPYDDHSSWLMVLDHKLDFRFEPVELTGEFSYLQVVPVVEDETPYLIAMHQIYGSQHKHSALYTFNDYGTEKYKTNLIEFDTKRLAQIFSANYKGEDRLFIASMTDQTIGLINTRHERKGNISDWDLRWPPVFLDIDNDGNNEIVLFNNQSSKMRVFQSNFTHPVDIDLFEPTHQKPIVTLKKSNEKPVGISVQAGNFSTIFTLHKNVLYNFRYLLYAIVYLVILTMIFFLQHMTSLRINKKIAIERQLSTLQINNLLTQLDPHFTFNTLHSIGSYILKEKKEEAYDYLVKFSQVIRSGLSDADKVCRSLKNEIAILVNYLELQKQAYPEKFGYEINIAENVDRNWMVPKMILHTHVENALKHGIFTRPGNGTVKLEVSAGKRSFTIVIEDNGIGREEAAKINGQTTRKGLDLFNRFIEYFNNSNAEKIQQVITDLYNPDGTPAGTRVSISIPIQYNYSLSGT